MLVHLARLDRDLASEIARQLDRREVERHDVGDDLQNLEAAFPALEHPIEEAENVPLVLELKAAGRSAPRNGVE